MTKLDFIFDDEEYNYYIKFNKTNKYFYKAKKAGTKVFDFERIPAKEFWAKHKEWRANLNQTPLKANTSEFLPDESEVKAQQKQIKTEVITEEKQEEEENFIF